MDCSTCECKYSQHFPTYCETQEIDEEVVDDKKDEEIHRKLSLKEEKARVLAFLSVRLVKLKEEKEVIDRVNSVFAVFLKHRSITPFNDAYEKYLDYLVENEKRDMNPNSLAKLDRLKEQKMAYLERKALIENGSGTDDKSANIHWVDIDELYIEGLVNNLCSLEINGGTIKNAIEAKDKFARRDVALVQNLKALSKKFELKGVSSIFPLSFCSLFTKKE